MVDVRETRIDTSWDIPRDVAAIASAIAATRTVKTQMRVYFIGEDHWTSGDQQRRHGVAKVLRQMGRPAYPLHTIVERGLDVDQEGLPNVFEEDTAMHANFRMRNENVVDQMIDVLKGSHTLPDFVLLFGENHGTEKRGFNQQHGIQNQLATRINEAIRDGHLSAKSITGVAWQTFRSIAACVEELPDSPTCLPRDKIKENNFVGLVEYDAASQDHNMLLAEKGLVKAKFFVEVRNLDAISTGDYWELYAERSALGEQLIEAAQSARYGVFAKVAIQSVGPALRVRAFRSAQSPRKKEWKKL
jgi:hypothetical protein